MQIVWCSYRTVANAGVDVEVGVDALTVGMSTREMLLLLQPPPSSSPQSRPLMSTVVSWMDCARRPVGSWLGTMMITSPLAPTYSLW